MSWNPADDGWCSGFIDGEGCFTISLNRTSGTYAPSFRIDLRADDLAILESLRSEFGGSFCYRDRDRDRDKGPGCNPTYQWTLGSKRDLARLVRYLDKFPLHAKKRLDYAVWRRAVSIYCDRRPGSVKAPELAALKEALQAGRVFAAPDDDQVLVPPVQLHQLHLVMDGEAIARRMKRPAA